MNTYDDHERVHGCRGTELRGSERLALPEATQGWLEPWTKLMFLSSLCVNLCFLSHGLHMYGSNRTKAVGTYTSRYMLMS